MTKEEILQKEYSSRIMNWEKAYQQHPSIFESAHAAMDQYAEQESISFAEWVAKEGWYFNKIQRWSNRGEKSDNLIEVLSATKSTAELYQLYKKETQQTKTS